MCAISVVSQDRNQRNQQLTSSYYNGLQVVPFVVSKTEWEAMKAEMESLKKLLLAAKKYDEETRQPDCEELDKVKVIKWLAKAVDVDLSEIYK